MASFFSRNKTHTFFALILLLLSSCQHSGSLVYYYSFETPEQNNEGISLISPWGNINNWQIGAPHKKHFTTAHSGSMAMVTDTAISYAAGTTSTFILAHKVSTGIMYNKWTAICGAYYVNSDTLTDYGLIEFSPDNGRTWIDLLHDNTGLTWWQPTFGHSNIFSGNSSGWQNFYCELHFDGTPYAAAIGDTILYRFSFIADDVDTHKDGLMFDDLRILDDTADTPIINALKFGTSPIHVLARN